MQRMSSLYPALWPEGRQAISGLLRPLRAGKTQAEVTGCRVLPAVYSGRGGYGSLCHKELLEQEVITIYLGYGIVAGNH